MSRPIIAQKRFESAMAAYESNLRATGRSEKTIENEDRIFKLFSGFMLENDLWDHEEGFVEIQAWRDHMVRSGRKPSTVKQYLTVLSALYRFASSEQLGADRWYERNPVAPLLMPDTSRSSRRPYEQLLTDEQVILLWRNSPPKRATHPELWARNYAIVILLLTTEIRNAELLALTPHDLHWEDAEIVVDHGKGDKYRVVDFPLIAQTAVRMYLQSGVRPSCARDDEPLFGTQSSKTFGAAYTKSDPWHAGSGNWLSEVVRRHVRSVTGVDNIRSHDLRHVGARIDLNSGMPLEELQSKLGHESMSTTQIYSGKLTSRKSRKMTKALQEEKDRQTQRNIKRLEARGDRFFASLLPTIQTPVTA